MSSPAASRAVTSRDPPGPAGIESDARSSRDEQGRGRTCQPDRTAARSSGSGKGSCWPAQDERACRDRADPRADLPYGDRVSYCSAPVPQANAGHRSGPALLRSGKICRAG